MEITGYLPPDEFWAMHDRLDQEVRDGAHQLPLFHFADWNGPVMLGSWQMDGSEGGVIDAQRNPPPPEAVRLSRVSDVEPLLQARRAALKAIRGEA
ncbi:hypothetical protein LFT48_18365 [Arthrobacter sp. FW305-123]|nr:hypothetical protein LFT48_18365 [Arthrobacter sp. FW305-123]